MQADAGPGWDDPQSGIIRFNLSEPGGILDGVTISGAGDTPAAVMALTGEVRNVNVLQSTSPGVLNGSGVCVLILSTDLDSSCSPGAPCSVLLLTVVANTDPSGRRWSAHLAVSLSQARPSASQEARAVSAPSLSTAPSLVLTKDRTTHS